MNMDSVRRGIVILFLGSALSGCAVFKKESGEQLPAGAFRGTAALKSQTIPLPIEIATDIERITEEGKIERRKAREAPPEVVPMPVSEPTPEVAAKTADTATSPKKPVSKAKRVQTKTTQSHPLSGRRKFVRQVSASGKTQNYKVRPGDTLMKIAYSKYGSIFRWREIYNANRGLLKDFNKLEIGSVLVIHGVEFIVIEKNGEPYLIRRGDTLRSISQKLYGTPAQWRALWKNNQQLIRNPNRIYAGFILYYPPIPPTPGLETSRQATDNQQ